MGEVYKARDTRLDRTVAIKVLRAGAVDPSFGVRFDREARVVAQLTHPHICTLYDVGFQDGVPYLVIEYLEGETLAAVIAREFSPGARTDGTAVLGWRFGPAVEPRRTGTVLSRP